MLNSIPTTGAVSVVGAVCITRLVSKTRINWTANNAIPDSIIMNMICRSLKPSVEPNEPNFRSTEVGLDFKNTLRILNTIMPVIRAFTAMDVAKPVITKVFPQGAVKITSRPSCFTCKCNAPSPAIQIARRRHDKLKSPYIMKIDLLTYICDCQEWRYYHHADIFTPHDPTTVDLWRFGE